MWNMIFLVTGAIFIALLAFIFFSKRNVNSKENKIFGIIIIVNFIEYVCEISLQIIVRIFGINFNFVDILSKAYLMSIFTVFSIFSLYTLLISLNNKKTSYTTLKGINIIYWLVGSVAIVILPFEKYYDLTKMYISGSAIDLLKVLLAIYMVVWIVLLFKNHKNIKDKKYIPMFSILFLLVINVILQSIDPAILIATMVGTFICYTMYFTIENPDVKLLEEFKIAKDRAEKANKEKEIFLYNITQDIRMPLSNIKRASSWINDNLSDIDSKSIKDGMYYINDNASIVLDKVNNVLDITNMEITNIKVYNTKYNIRLVLDELYKVYSSKVNNNVKLNFNIDSNIPEYLNGDSLRLKQLLTIILDNSCKYTEKGYVELNLNTIVKKGICRLIITIEDTGIGIKASDIENIFNKNNQNYNSLDKIDDNKKNLAIAKSIATLLGGILLLESEIGKGTTITFVLDQKIYEEKSESLKKFENDITTYISKKKVMVIVEDIEYLEKVVKTLSKYDIDVIKMELAAKGLEYIRLNKECDLIIMDEELKYLSPLEVLNKFKNIPNFNIPVAILSNNSKYLEDGFNNILNRNLDNNELDNLINNE